MGETEEHWFLKQVALALLYRKGCSPAWTEVSLPMWEETPGLELPPSEYRIADAAGLKWEYVKEEDDRWSPKRAIRTVLAFEVKVSRSDFQRGFVTRGFGRLWLLTPPGLIDGTDLPAGVGFYECDPESGRLELRGRAAFTGFHPSQTALDDLERSMVWQGYGTAVAKKMKDDRLQRLLQPQRTLPSDPREGREE